ncbi:putative reverse transcriptase domain-containing protein [Tanacetum coccineum]
MTRSSMNELFTPYKEPEREFRSSRRHLKTLSLDELRSPDFNLLSDEEYSEEEEEEEMAETMEQYMRKTRIDYGSGVARPKIDNKDQFELKGQFLKEIRENIFIGSDNEDANEHTEKVLKIVDLFHVPNITILDSRGVVPTKTAADAKTAIQEMAEYSQKWHNGTSRERSIETSNGLAAIQAQLNNLGREIKKVNEKVYVAQEQRQSIEDTLSKFMSESAKRHEENSNLIKEIRASTNASIRNQGALIKTLEIQIRKISKEKDPRSFTLPCFINDFCFDNALVDLGASVSVMPLSTYLNLGLGELVHTRLTVELTDRTVKYPKGIAENVLVGIGKFTFPVYFIILDMPKDIRVPLILGRPFLSTARAKINLDLEARLMEETLVINRSLDPFLEDYIELNDLNEPFELRRNQGNDLMPTIEEGFESTHANFFPLLYVNMMSRIFNNSIMKNKMVYKGNNVVGALINVPIFVGTFSVITDFVVLENMDAYRDEGMGDVIFGEPFLRKADIKAKRFKGMITLYKGDDEVTYQMVRSHPRFKHHTNEQCNKIPPLLKVNEKDVMNGVSHAYQKLKGFDKCLITHIFYL